MDLRDYPLMGDMFTKGEVFANTQLEPGYPAFCASLHQEGQIIAMIALWDVPFEQQTLYRQNLFSVVSGLVQSALVRALHYFGSAQDMYIHETHILTDKAFRATLGVYNQMRKQRAAAYLLLEVKSMDSNTSIDEFDRRVGRATRSTDIAGQLENGKIYVLLPQASLENMPQIERRFSRIWAQLHRGILGRCAMTNGNVTLVLIAVHELLCTALLFAAHRRNRLFIIAHYVWILLIPIFGPLAGYSLIVCIRPNAAGCRLAD